VSLKLAVSGSIVSPFKSPEGHVIVGHFAPESRLAKMRINVVAFAGQSNTGLGEITTLLPLRAGAPPTLNAELIVGAGAAVGVVAIPVAGSVVEGVDCMPPLAFAAPVEVVPAGCVV